MQDSDANPAADLTTQSPHARQLKRGFPWLRFEPTLEQEFRQHYRAEYLPQIRRNLWIGMLFMVGMSLLTHLVLDARVSRTVDAIRL